MPTSTIASLLPITNQKIVKPMGYISVFKDSSSPEIPSCRLVVTPVPNFLFSEQTLKMLPQGGAYAMFSTSKYKIPHCCKTSRNWDRMIARHDF